MTYTQKHLRLRGENGTIGRNHNTFKETPPLTRRKLKMSSSPLAYSRNTSAYAEKTLAGACRGVPGWKHLRLRGENASVAVAATSKGETPPLTRRKPAKDRCRQNEERNTSAYAEKTKF